MAIELIDPFEEKRISCRTVRLKAKSPNVRKHLNDSERYRSLKACIIVALVGVQVEPNRKKRVYAKSTSVVCRSDLVCIFTGLGGRLKS